MVILADARDFGAFNKVYAGYFPRNPPARTTMEARLMIDIKRRDRGGRLQAALSFPETKASMRIFTASLATETNTFSPVPTDRASFEAAFYAAAGPASADADAVLVADGGRCAGARPRRASR